MMDSRATLNSHSPGSETGAGRRGSPAGRAGRSSAASGRASARSSRSPTPATAAAGMPARLACNAQTCSGSQTVSSPVEAAAGCARGSMLNAPGDELCICVGPGSSYTWVPDHTAVVQDDPSPGAPQDLGTAQQLLRDALQRLPLPRRELAAGGLHIQHLHVNVKQSR